MSLWGNNDSVYSTGTVTDITTGGVVTGNGTLWSANVSAGQVLTVGAGLTYGNGVVLSVDSDTQITLTSVSGLSGLPLVGGSYTYNINEAPKFTTHDSHWKGNEVYGSDATEVGVARTTIYSHDHAGWVGITTYVDGMGRTRTKTEVLVAMSSIQNDADDDAVLAD